MWLKIYRSKWVGDGGLWWRNERWVCTYATVWGLVGGAEGEVHTNTFGPSKHMESLINHSESKAKN